MDAVVFMDAVKTSNEPPPPPPPPSERKPQGITANAALIAGVATLVLAIGVGVLIGKAGNDGSATAANQTPQIIRVGGGGGEEEAAPEAEASTSKKKKGGGKAKKATPKKEAKADEEGEAAADEVLHSKVDTVKSGTQLGEECDPSEAGCSKNGKFEGEFFGE
jgi:hypothetical protein